jgi:hypothetical protein
MIIIYGNKGNIVINSEEKENWLSKIINKFVEKVLKK